MTFSSVAAVASIQVVIFIVAIIKHMDDILDTFWRGKGHVPYKQLYPDEARAVGEDPYAVPTKKVQDPFEQAASQLPGPIKKAGSLLSWFQGPAEEEEEDYDSDSSEDYPVRRKKNKRKKKQRKTHNRKRN